LRAPHNQQPEQSAGGGGIADLDLVCHLLDAEGRALCFANVSGRPVHDSLPPDTYITFPRPPETTCDGCGRPRCPVCGEIDRALDEIAA
jgi:hypothetical protein